MEVYCTFVFWVWVPRATVLGTFLGLAVLLMVRWIFGGAFSHRARARWEDRPAEPGLLEAKLFLETKLWAVGFPKGFFLVGGMLWMVPVVFGILWMVAKPISPFKKPNGMVIWFVELSL